MSYEVFIEKFRITPISSLAEEVYKRIEKRNPKMTRQRIKDYIENKSLSKAYWANVLEPLEMDRYLVNEEEYLDIKKNYLSTVRNPETTIEDLEEIFNVEGM